MAYPATHNMSYYYGDTYEFAIVPRHFDGTVFDLTGWTAAFTVANHRRGEYPATPRSFALPASIVAGKVVCAIDKTFVLTGPEWDDAWVYDVEIKKGDKKHTLLEGTLSIRRDVTL